MEYMYEIVIIGTMLVLNAVFTAFDAHLRLGGALGFLELAEISHWDLITATLGTTEYHALKFDLSVTETYTAAIGL